MDDGGPYAAIYGGGNWLADSDVVVGGVPGEAEFDTGYIVGGAVGYGVGFGLVAPRAELDVSYRDNDFDQVTLGGVTTPGTGDVTALSGMTNLWFDVPMFGQFKPYFGGGVGASRVAVDDGVNTDEDTVFAWQLGAGLAYQFTPMLAATVDYRWFNAEDPSFNLGGANVDAEYRAHSAMAGLRFNF